MPDNVDQNENVDDPQQFAYASNVGTAYAINALIDEVVPTLDMNNAIAKALVLDYSSAFTTTQRQDILN